MRESGSFDAELRAAIRDVPDFPKPGILFRDITGVLADAELLRRTVIEMAAPNTIVSAASAGRDIRRSAGPQSQVLFITNLPVAE